jgi:O-acetyl-ADP-ribose deacetylase (regulator of RNase III)
MQIAMKPLVLGGKGVSFMNKSEKRIYLIQELLKERREYQNIVIPVGTEEQKQLLRALMNVRMAADQTEEFLKIQDAYLQEAIREKGIVSLGDLTPLIPGIYLWQGDITTLAVDAIVNAANSGMTGCYHPNHNCIDNCIHTYSGIQLRKYCQDMMDQQGQEEPTGQAKITPAYNLPCKYVIHTVGPIVQGKLTEKHCTLLKSCYRSCLELAEESGVTSIAFCCISTGVFMFPNDKAAKIAVETVESFRKETGSRMKVVFNVFKNTDYEIYKKLIH